jgi:hypothetical protein
MTQKKTGANDAGHIASNGTTTLKSGRGMLQCVTINSKGGGGNTATIYDSTTGSGAVLAVVDTSQVQTLTYCIQFNNGLTIVTAGGTPPDLTVGYT